MVPVAAAGFRLRCRQTWCVDKDVSTAEFTGVPGSER